MNHLFRCVIRCILLSYVHVCDDPRTCKLIDLIEIGCLICNGLGIKITQGVLLAAPLLFATTEGSMPQQL